MKIHYLQHVAFEGLGSIADWALEKDARVSATRLFAGESLPEELDMNLLIVMGGPMGVYDEDMYPWLVREKEFLRRAIEQGVKILGVCLGAQLLADVLGARVYKNKEREIGWHEIEGVEASVLGGLFSEPQEVFHWHGDTFDLPAGAIHLAKSEACENQAFLYNEHVLGLQFHLETTESLATELLHYCEDEVLAGGSYVQTKEEMLCDTSKFLKINELMARCLDCLRCSIRPKNESF